MIDAGQFWKICCGHGLTESEVEFVPGGGQLGDLSVPLLVVLLTGLQDWFEFNVLFSS